MKRITEMVHRNTSKVYIFAKVTAVITSTCPYGDDFKFLQVLLLK